jgi:hypothetical protein
VILWSSQKLEQALAKGQLDSWTKVKYLLIPAVMGALSAEPFFLFRPVYGKEPPAINDLFFSIFAIITAFITYWGIKACFKVNTNIDGKDFLERFVVLTLPVIIRIFSFYIPCGIVLLAIIGPLKDRDPTIFYRATIIFSAFSPIITYMMYSMIKNSFKRFGRWLERETPAGS